MPFLRKLKISCVAGIGALLLAPAGFPQDSGAPSHLPDPASQAPQPQPPPAPASKYDPAIFQNLIPHDQLAFLNGLAGTASGDAVRDKQFRKLMHSVIPDCVFHYGWDMPLSEAVEKVLTGSTVPIEIRDARYVMAAGRSGPYLGGRGFLWIDLQEGIALGAFYFHPTNGEPTPTVTVFSKQVKEKALGMSQLPPEFQADFMQWSRQSRVPPLTTRYFITGLNKRILLEHDEDYCAMPGAPATPDDDACQQMNADAADIDLNAAYYLDQVNYLTNATAWMIVGDEQTTWLHIRDNTCRTGPEPLRCRVRLTRERTRVVLNRRSAPHPSRR
jgi:uncharacterized protein YecT (DUF1311 family)